MKFRRRTYITDTKLQVKFTLLFVLVSFAASVISVAAFNFYAVKEMETLIWSTHMDINSTGDIIKPLFSYVNIVNFLFISVLLSITGMWMIKKTTGPLYRMSEDINRIADGNLSANITLRQKDEFQDTADELNRMTESIREVFKGISESYESVSDKLLQLKEGDNLTQSCKEVLENIEEVKKSVRIFKVY